VNVRPATAEDDAALKELRQEFNAEVPEPPGFVESGETPGEFVYVAEDDGAIVGFLEASAPAPKRWHLDIVHVRAPARRRGVATALMRACVGEARAHGAEWVSLEVLATHEEARDVWRRLGFEEVEFLLSQRLDALEQRLAGVPVGPSRASTHVQTDDRTSVERALEQFVPRLAEPDVHDAANGWIRIADPLLDADRDAQARFATDLSDRLGAVVVALALEHGTVVRFRLYERGRMVDEYLSVPSFYGVLSKGDELALAANPTLVARLTGADPDAVRRVARTAASVSELPPAEELYRRLAELMGLEP
jgi:ribosomal protein S18 acetylase RimI-like enzyme